MPDTKKINIPNKPWSISAEEVCQSLAVEATNGLDEKAVQSRRNQFGHNRLRSAKRKSAWTILIDQFKSLLVALLLAGAILSFIFSEWLEGVAILAVILINALIGFLTELRAVRSMEALQRLGNVEAKVRRNGQVSRVPAQEIVPGDIVVLEGGDVVTADLRLVEVSKLQANESALTGESVPVGKQVPAVDEKSPLVERTCMVYKGTAITRGSGEGVVVAIGMNTELGNISELVEEAEDTLTPLEKRLNQLGRKLVYITLGIAVVVAVVGILGGRDVLTMIETAIALAVATVPEGLPIVATIALARGMQRMARRQALINRLSSVEALGATNLICTDKTGTLTENQMAVGEITTSDSTIQIDQDKLEKLAQEETSSNENGEKPVRLMLQIGVLCNNASLGAGEGSEEKDAVGDPLEIALLAAGARAGLERKNLLEEWPEVREIAFDADSKMMATIHQKDDRFRVAVKGAPEPVLRSSSRILVDGKELTLNDEQREKMKQDYERMAQDGLRVLALATRVTEGSPPDEAYKDLTFLGLVGLLDPPREDVQPALAACQNAGIQVVMVTGDHPATARKIAQAVGLTDSTEVKVIHGSELPKGNDLADNKRDEILDAQIFARVTPEQKLDLIAIYQDAGYIVAMTGDGVNDAPALKKADIGVAMGKRGTQVAKEAADMVLQDDKFASIVAAVEQGRVIFENIRKFSFYLISCNISEIGVITLASLINVPLPLQPLQILFLNLVTDVFPALALGMSNGEAGIMQKPPRKTEEPILTRSHWFEMSGFSALIMLAVLGVMFAALTGFGMERQRATTISFLTLAFAQLWHVFNMRDNGTSFWKNEIVRNPWVWGALVLCTGLLLAAVYVPGLNTLLKVVDPGLTGWALIMGASLLPWLAGQIYRTLKKKRIF